MALALGDQPAPHLLQLALQPSDHLRKVEQLAGVQPLGVLQGALQAFLLNTSKQGVNQDHYSTGPLYVFK